MTKTILITGATDGIGLLTAKTLAADGHTVLLHGRSDEKLEAAAQEVGGSPETYRADLSDLDEVASLAQEIRARHERLDVLINNAGVLKAPQTRTQTGLDLRFVVNTLAPWVLTQHLLPILPKDGRVVNLSSAAQAPADIAALRGERPSGRAGIRCGQPRLVAGVEDGQGGLRRGRQRPVDRRGHTAPGRAFRRLRRRLRPLLRQ